MHLRTRALAAVVSVSFIASMGVTTATPSLAATVPDVPTNVSASPGNSRADVSWTAPTNDGGSPISSYEVRTSGPNPIYLSSFSALTQVGGVGGIAVAPDDSALFVSKSQEDVVEIRDPQTGQIQASIPVGRVPQDLVFDSPRHLLYVANTQEQSVSVIDELTQTVTNTIAIGGNPERLVMTPDGSKLYVTQPLSNDVAVIDTAAGTYIGKLPVGTNPGGLAVNPAGSELWVTNRGSGSISVFATMSGTLIRTMPVSAGIDDIAFSPDGHQAFQAFCGGLYGSVSKVNPDAPLTPSVPVQYIGGSCALRLQTSLNSLIVMNYDLRPQVINTDTGAFVDYLASPASFVAISKEGRRIYLAGYGIVTSSALFPTCQKQTSDPGPLACSITGLTNGRSTAFVVSAINSVGRSAVSLASLPITPRSPPYPPSGYAAVPGDGSATVSWWVPNFDGGSPITGYLATANPGGATCSTTVALSCVISGLTNGQAYTFSVEAFNVAGSSGGFPTSPVVPRTVPDPPTSVIAVPSDQTVSVSWQPPAFNGGATIDSYSVGTTPSGGYCQVVGLSATCWNLTNGVSYSLSIFAHNVAGNSVAAQTSVTPRTTPDAPSSLMATPGNQVANLSWLSPVNNGGSPISSYAVTSSPADGLCVVSGLTAVCSGLKNGTAYSFAVSAVNAAGAGPGVTSSVVTPRTVPDAPTNVIATRGNTTASITWSAPASDGGTPIVSYSLSATPADGTCVVAGLTAACTGLTNGKSYTFAVTARNAAGDSLESTSSNAVAPSALPDIPTRPSVVAGNASASVSWSPPLSDGGSPITGYTAYVTPGLATCSTTIGVTTDPFKCTVLGLTNGMNYTVFVAARNAVGLGAALSFDTVTPDVVPDAPNNVVATRGNSSVTVKWEPPTPNGGTPITSYLVSPLPDNGTCHITGLTAVCVGLTNGISYQINVKARNAAGDSNLGAVSNSVTPATLPSAPTNVTASPADRSATISWSSPVSNGGSPVTGYTVTLEPGGAACSTSVGVTSDPLSCTVSGLTNGTQYSVFVVARNAVGDGPGAPSPLPSYAVGSTGPAGGVIFYDAGAEQSWGRFLESSPVWWSGGPDNPDWQWCGVDVPTGSTGVTVGSGRLNTNTALRYCANGAAQAATAYRGGGYSDWFLPSKDELNLLHASADLVGGFTFGAVTCYAYWSSSEDSSNNAWAQVVSTPCGGPGVLLAKTARRSIRPIRYVSSLDPAVAAIVTPNDGLPSQIGLLPSSVSTRDYSSVTLAWSIPFSWGNAVTDHKVRISSNAGESWTELSTGSAAGSFRIAGLPYASARLVEVAAIDSKGQGPWSAPLLVTTKGAQQTRVTVQTADGHPVSGGSITWSAVSARSSVAYGLTADGLIDFPSAPAGAVTVTLTGGQLPDGTLVSGTWNATLGFDTNVLRLPAAPTATHQVHVTLPGGLPVSNAQVSVTGLSSNFQSGGFTFTRPAGGISGVTDASGVVTATGFTTGSVMATVVYDDGVITQTPSPFDASAADSYLELEYSPFVQTTSTTGTANSGAGVNVTLSAVNPIPAAGLRRSVVTSHPQAGVAITLLLPAGASKGTCGAKLTGSTGANGKVTLKVCATKSGVVRVKSAGAVPVGAFTLLVKGKPSLAPQSLTAKSKVVANAGVTGSATLSWAKPFFTGGAPVTSYKAVLTAVGKPAVTKTLTVKASTPLKMTIAGLAHARRYTVKLYAITKYGTSDPVVTTVPVA